MTRPQVFQMPSSAPMPDNSRADGQPRALGREFMRYTVVGGLAFVADWAVLKLCLLLGLQYLAATAAGFMVGLALNYTLCVVWAWRGTSATTARDFAVFALIGLGGLLLTELLMRLAVGTLGVPAPAAKVPIAGLVFLWNFGLRRVLVFFR
jgi:putative flippase GtrA